MRSNLRRRLRTGDYLAGDHELFHVEQISGDRALVEDCITYVLIDLPISELAHLRRVERERAAAVVASPPVLHSR